MQATQAREIDGLSFSVSQLPPMKALRMLNRLRRCIGPALGKALGGMSAKSLKDVDVTALADAIEALNLPDQELEDITKELLYAAFVTHEGVTGALLSGGQFNAVMSGRVGTILKLIAFAVEVNYGSFFVALRALAPARAVTSPSPSP